MSDLREEDDGPLVKAARGEARRRLPCSGCGGKEEPELRRPRYLSEAWHRSPAAYFGCRRCGQRLSAITGLDASIPSDSAIDRIPDPEGTLRAFMIRDPLAPLRLGRSHDAPLSVSMRSILGPPLAGIELRSRVAIRLPGESDCVVPLAFTRNGRPWVVWRAVEVPDAGVPPTGDPSGALSALPGVGLVEAAFTVLVDARAGWQVFSDEERHPGRVLPPRGRGFGRSGSGG